MPNENAKTEKTDRKDRDIELRLKCCEFALQSVGGGSLNPQDIVNKASVIFDFVRDGKIKPP